jgi:hypothetical protein
LGDLSSSHEHNHFPPFVLCYKIQLDTQPKTKKINVAHYIQQKYGTTIYVFEVKLWLRQTKNYGFSAVEKVYNSFTWQSWSELNPFESIDGFKVSVTSSIYILTGTIKSSQSTHLIVYFN